MLTPCELAGVFLLARASAELGSLLLSLDASSPVTVISSPITFDSA
jgi:hypothetical protein